jgi:hypothetical protein
MRLSRNEIEGAIFPLEAYHGADRQSYERFRQAMTEGGATEISPVSEAGYFGMRLLLSAFEAGAASRGDVRDYLDGELRGDAESRFAEAQSLSLVIVRSGRVQEFEPPRPR